MAGRSDTAERLASLPDRFRGDSSVGGRWRLTIGRCKPRDVVIEDGVCNVEAAAGAPLAEIATDPQTWAAIDDGRSSGIEAFAEQRLWVRGSIQRALEFEPLFRRPAAGGLSYEVKDVPVGRHKVNALFAGDATAEPLLLLHGLGATKSSWLTVVPDLARHHRVIAVDLPGFGYSSKPRARYDAPFFARAMFRFLDATETRPVFVAGNSMGGRIAMEMAMMEPRRVRAIGCLCPAGAFSRRPGLNLVRLLRPELAVGGLFLPRGRVKAGLRQLFADPGCLDDRWYEAAIDEFFTMWRSPRFRMAVAAAARRIYLDEPGGENGFWTRLERATTPLFCVYGRHDVLISSSYERLLAKALPGAHVEVWEDCGHVPQIEFPRRTAERLLGFFGASGRAAQAV